MTPDPNKCRAADQESANPTARAGTRSIPLAGNRLESRDLFIATREITIHHGGEVYRLRLTGQNKLILTK